MRKIMFLILLFMLLTPFAFADREEETVKAYTSNTLIQRGDVKIYRIEFVAKANNSSFAIYDSLTPEAGSTTNVKTEGSEATANNSKFYDFTNKPLEFSTGAYLVISGTADVVVHYK